MHHRQSRGERQRVDTNPVSGYQRVGTDIKCLHTALERLKGGRDILGSPDFKGGHVEAERARRCLKLSHFQRGEGIFHIGHYRQPAETGEDLAQQSESLTGKIS
jgi:hypothetical protein